MTIQLNNISFDHMEMLSRNRQSLNEQIRQLQEHEIKLVEKKTFFRQEIERNQEKLGVFNDLQDFRRIFTILVSFLSHAKPIRN